MDKLQTLLFLVVQRHHCEELAIATEVPLLPPPNYQAVVKVLQ